MNVYHIRNRVLHKWETAVEANSAQEACEKVGWLIGDCDIIEDWRNKGRTDSKKDGETK